MGKYQIIYADPPWHFETYSNPSNGKTFREGTTIWRSAEVHYTCMTLADLSKLPIKSITDNNCVLFMWATYPMLESALALIRSWGFTYKTVAFTWVKQNKTGLGWHFGTGYWTRANAEICLLATIGHPKRISASVSQLILTPVSEHSRKPDEARGKIIELIGDLHRIELFARQKTEGWDVWGNEVESDIELIPEKDMK